MNPTVKEEDTKTEQRGKSPTAKREEEVLAFWKERGIFEKTLAKKVPRGDFVFYDGPPFATGLPHHGSLLSSIIKDVVPRYKTMRGYHVRRRWGWDCHGLPIENIVEKELGLKTKKDIEEIGIDVFNEKARSTVLRYVSDWKTYIDRIGRWVDYENSYKTMDNTYIESVWWVLKRLNEKSLLYEGRKVLMYCPHCETPLAKAEIAADNTYKDITEESITAKFKVRNPEKYGFPKNTYILAWTTTPWTLPGNVALAVGRDIDYVLLQNGDQYVVTALALAPKNLEILRKAKGSDLIGLEYEPLYEIPAITKYQGKKHVVLSADFVSTEEGTGIVHTAVMYGEDDFVLGQKEKLPMVQLLNPNATYNSEAPEFIRGLYIKGAEKLIKDDLESRGLLYERKNHTHSYPHCWRCGTPLIYNAVPSWFIDIQKVKSKMLSENEKINWVPEHLKEGRFRNIVENAPDWTISRNRFWASPLPIWKEKGGSEIRIIGSLEELNRLAKKSGNRYFVLRHGEAESNVKNIVSSRADDGVDLTQKGKGEAARAAEVLKDKKIDLIISSPFPRTKHTAEIVREALGISQSSVRTDELLSEINTGVFHGGPLSKYHSHFSSLSEKFDKRPEGGETLTDLKRRVGGFLEKLEKEYSGKNILIVTHEYPTWMLFVAAKGADRKEALSMNTTDDFLKTGEVRELTISHVPKNKDYELDLHRPYADTITVLDEAGKEYTRIPEVIDCWVESGSMPFAEYHYPFENKEIFERKSPGDFIAEYVAQTRTWFYYMHAIGVLLFNRLSFRNVVSTGTILAADGEKISKSKRNYTDPIELINTFGSDAIRFYLMSSPVMQGEDVNFRDEDVKDAHNRVIRMLVNCLNFFELYKSEYDKHISPKKSPNILDRWILARLNTLVRESTDAFDRYDMPQASRLIRDFVDEYSTWYIRRSRDRVKGENVADKKYAIATERHVLETVSLLIAPLMPFLAEHVYLRIGGEHESVHLASWPSAEKRGFLWFAGSKDTKLTHLMNEVRKLVSEALKVREEAGIKVRQPLQSVSIPNKEIARNTELSSLLKDELNVKEVLFSSGAIAMDTTLTPELKKEGMVRDLIREIQDKRKEMKLMPGDMISVSVKLSENDFSILKDTREEVEKETNATEVNFEARNAALREITILKS